MYIDVIIVSGVVVILGCCVLFWLVGRYAWRHYQQDVKQSQNGLKD